MSVPVPSAAHVVDSARDVVRIPRQAQSRGSVSPVELALLALILAVALTARIVALDSAGLNHYDEGVYATSAMAVAGSGEAFFPNQVRFSPPFYFGTAGLALRVFGGPPDRVLILLNVILGTLTVAALWVVGRSWFGARAALITAMLLATSQFHVLLSRVALTDVAFAFWFVLALAALSRAVEHADFRLALLAGLLTGLAWNTKYHGWFVLVITGVALVPMLWRSRRSDQWRRPLAIWATAAVTAGIAYLPWALFMRETSSGAGGYGAIITYFATMLRGAWFANVAHHAGQQWYLDGALARAGLLGALAVGLVFGATGRARATLVAAALGAAAVTLGQGGTALALTVVAAPMLWRSLPSYRSQVLVVWLLLWIVAAPFYHPYARLLLPFTCATLLCSGFVIDRLLGATSARRPVQAIGVAAAAALLFVLLRGTDFDAGDPWRDGRQLADAAGTVSSLVPSDQRLHVIGEPSLAHYLRVAGRDAALDVRPAVLDTLSAPAYLVVGVYADRAPPLANRLAAMTDRLTRIGTIPFHPNDLRLLDDLKPNAARRYRATPDTLFDLTVYHLDAR